MTFWEHIEELRQTLLRAGLAILLAALLSFVFHKPLFQLLLAPLEKPNLEKQVLIKERITARKATTLSLPEGEVHLQAGESIDIEVPKKGFYLFSPTEGFISVLKVSFWAGLLLSSPVWLLFILHFIQPALRKKERGLIFPFLGLSVLFISVGLLFAYTVTLPIVSRFFMKFNESIGENLWGLGQALDFTLTLVLAHGIVFELYVGLLFLIRFNLITAYQLKRARRPVIVLILVLAALLTPPDLLSQLLLAAPMLILYETTVVYATLRSAKITVN